jgi:diaminopimelate decarboxylase
MKAVDAGLIARLAEEYGTPYYLYDAGVIRERLASLRAFDVVRYAQKACSNVHILRLLRDAGACVDAVSPGELERAVRAGFSGGGEPAGVVYTADIIDDAALDRVLELDVPVNAGSTDMLEQLGRRRAGHRVWIRVNPGFGHGLHMHIGSGTEFDHLRKVCDAMVSQVQTLGVDVRAISGGGGLPIPYHLGEERIDTAKLYALWQVAREAIVETVGHPVSLEIEPGRFLVGESGVLVAEVRAIKRMGLNHFVLVDAGFNDLARPAMYGSHHEISIVERSGAVASGPTQPTVVGGPLCESGDVFTQEEGGLVVPRDLPEAGVGDWVVLHDAGAYAASMASNYNTRALAPEILLADGEIQLIRRRQALAELLELEDV